MRNYIKISKCPPPAKGIIDFANLLPENYSLDWAKYPDFNSAKQKEWFFELVKSLPNEFIGKYHWLKNVIKGEKVSADIAIEELAGHFVRFPLEDKHFAYVRKMFETIWLEFLMVDGEAAIYFSPLEELTKGLLQKAISCRRVLTNLTQEEWGVKHTIGGKPVIKGELLKNCHLTRNPKTGIVELGANFPLKTIISEQLDTRRFRVCPVCNIFFWAKRMDAKTCGKKQCAEKKSAKDHHAKNKEEINRAKRIEYYEKHGIEFCPKCFYKAGQDCECNTKRRMNDGTL